MTTNSSNLPLESFAVNPKTLPPFLNWNRAPNTNDIYNPGTRIQDSSVVSPVIYETTGGGVWAVTGTAGVSTITGTAFQINASASTGAVTLSLIGPYTPATYTAYGVLIGEGTSSIVASAAGTNGQVFLGSTGANPVFATLTSSDGSIAFTTGAGTLDLTTSLTTDLASPPPIGNVAPNTGAFTTLAANAGLTVSAGGAAITGTTTINNSGAAVTTIGTGGTGAVNIGNATGNTAVTGNLTASTGLAATTGGLTVSAGGAAITGTTTINNSGAAVTTIGTGGTGAVNIGNATGNTAVTGTLTSTAGITASSSNIVATLGNITASAGNIAATLGSITAGTTVTGGTGLIATTGGVTASAGNIVATLGNISASAGSVTAATTLTATLGAITATNGNLVLGTAGNKILSTSVATTTTAGANSFGSVTLVGGTATVNTSAVTASSLIVIWRQSVGSTGAAALGELSVGIITGATSFVINAWQPADATALQASDVSVVGWFLIN